jgi:hypothetical protein
MNLREAHSGLLRAVRALIADDPLLADWTEDAWTEDGWAEGGRPTLVVEDFDSEPWASLTFTGTRHSLLFRLEGPEEAVLGVRRRLCSRLEEPDLKLKGHFLADAELTDVSRESRECGRMSLCLRLLALTIRE